MILFSFLQTELLLNYMVGFLVTDGINNKINLIKQYVSILFTKKELKAAGLTILALIGLVTLLVKI
jgi:hypothetical protein